MTSHGDTKARSKIFAVACALVIVGCDTAQLPSPPPAVVAALRGSCLIQFRGDLEIIRFDGGHLSVRLPMNEHSKSLGWGRVSQNGMYAAVYASPPRAIDSFLVGVALDDGHELWEVPNEPHSRPAISRDATRVAFDDQEARIIHIYDVPSRELKALRIHGENPAWDPQSHRLAYDDGVNTIVYDVASETSFSIGAGTEPSWSADGESIAVRVGPTDVDLPFISVRTNPGEIDLLNLKTGSRRQLVPASSYIVPRWSPDGEWMIYTRRGHASTVGAAATEPQTIVIRNTKSGAEMSLGDVPGKANPIDYTWVENERLCRPSGG